MRFGSALLVASLWAGDASAQPSFDCAKAAGSSEKAICASSEASRVDAAFAARWAEVTATLPAFVFEALKERQRIWLRDRDFECGADVKCLVHAYAERRATLERVAELKLSFNLAASQDAETLVRACWALSEHDRDSGVTSRMVEGTVLSTLCLEAWLLDQLQAAGGKHPRAGLAKRLDAVEAAAVRAFQVSHEKEYDCRITDGSCGTIIGPLSVVHIAGAVEDLVRRVVAARNAKKPISVDEILK